MFVNIIIVLIMVGLAVLFFVLARRSLRARHAWIKWPGMILSGLLALVFAAAVVVVLVGYYKLNYPSYQYTVADVKVAASPEQIAHGELRVHACADCHSSDGSSLPLNGSKDNFMAGGPPLGVLYAPNLTPGGPLKNWTDGQIIRAIREGVDKDGRPLVIMPSQAFHALSDADAQEVVAYLRSQPADPRVLPTRSFTPLAAAFLGLGMFPTSAQTPITAEVTAPPAGPTAPYGEYLTHIMGCRDCHGPDLHGQAAAGNGPPGGPNLSALVPQMQEQDFISIFRNGTLPGGRQINPDNMPWKNLGRSLSNDDLKALYQYIHGLPPFTGASQ